MKVKRPDTPLGTPDEREMALLVEEQACWEDDMRRRDRERDYSDHENWCRQ